MKIPSSKFVQILHVDAEKRPGHISEAKPIRGPISSWTHTIYALNILSDQIGGKISEANTLSNLLLPLSKPRC